MASRNALLLLLVLCILAIVGGRLYSRKSAADFGGALAGSFTALGDESFADTKELKAFLVSPEMKKRSDTVKTFSILGGGYDVRMDEVQKGLIYLSEQMALPQDRRFGTMPVMHHFTIEPAGSSDRSVSDAAEKLILDYRRQIL